MTRQEFIDDITSWWELIDFCNDEGYEEFVEDIFDEEDRDSYINDNLLDMARNADSWEDLYSTLGDIPTGYDYYRRDDYGEWSGADDYDFNAIKDDLLDRLDEDEFWEDYDEEEEPLVDGYFDPDDLDPVEDEDMDVSELFTTCASTLQKLDSAENDDEADPLDEFLLKTRCFCRGSGRN